MTPDPTANPDGHVQVQARSSSPAGQHRDVRMFQLARTECLQLLASSQFGRVAFTMGDGPPAIRPVNYVFDERSQSVAFRTASGSKLHALVRAAKAAFEVDEIDPQTRSGWSVIIGGVAEEVTSASDIRRLETLGLDVWAPGHRVHWVRIRAWTVSGRRIVHRAERHSAEGA